MTETMVERVAAAIATSAGGGEPLEYYLGEARAAIEALRNPSKVMTDAGRQAVYEYTGLPDKRPHICDAVALSWAAFNAMIDAALNEGDAK